jgi:hypothetical protein
MSLLKKIWKDYKYRFTPWLVFNLPQKAKTVQKGYFVNHQKCLSDLEKMAKKFQKPPYSVLFRGDIKDRRETFAQNHHFNQAQLYDQWGFNLEIASSGLDCGAAGRGVFVKKGRITKGQIAALYPGIVYQPFHPILLASIRNAYIFRCSDGILIDGKARGLSGLFYRSLHGRDRIQGID